MAEYYKFLNPTLRAYHALGGRANNEQILNQVIENLDEPPHDIERLRTRLLVDVRTCLRKLGLIENRVRARQGRHGEWELTAEGRETESVDLSRVRRCCSK